MMTRAGNGKVLNKFEVNKFLLTKVGLAVYSGNNYHLMNYSTAKKTYIIVTTR